MRKHDVTVDSALDPSARQHARAQWNSTACGELPGEKDNVAYFDAVEADRTAQQPWMRSYFQYERYAGRRVLEIGVGQGTDLMRFAQAGAEVHGLDITDNHLALTKRNFDLRGKPVDLRKGDAAAIPFPDDHFDCVYSFGVVHHIPEIERVIREARRVLRPGGVLMIAVYHKWSAFIFQKLLIDGLLRGWILTKGYDGFLATVESGADGVTTKPYVRLYDRGSLRGILHNFVVDDVSVHQLRADHFPPGAMSVAKPFLRLLEPVAGWYVAAQARKPG